MEEVTSRQVRDARGNLHWQHTRITTTRKKEDGSLIDTDEPGTNPHLVSTEVTHEEDHNNVEVVDGPLGKIVFKTPPDIIRVTTKTEVYRSDSL